MAAVVDDRNSYSALANLLGYPAMAEPKVKPLGWTTDRPTVPGTYMRVNPMIAQMLRVQVWANGEGELVTSDQQGGWKAIPLIRLHTSFLWFGPIPQPTQAERDRAMKKG